MPRPRLSSVEKRRRAVERTTRWRRQLAGSLSSRSVAEAAGPFIYSPQIGPVAALIHQDDERNGLQHRSEQDGNEADDIRLPDEGKAAAVWVRNGSESAGRRTQEAGGPSNVRDLDEEESDDFIYQGDEGSLRDGGQDEGELAADGAQETSGLSSDMDLDGDELDDPVYQDNSDSFLDIDEYDSEPVDPIDEERDELADTIEGEAGSEVQEDEVSNLDEEEDDDDEALLQSQLLDDDPPPPSIDFAHELGRHLSEARVPMVMEGNRLLTGAERVALPLPNWPLAFEGRLAVSDDNGDSSEEGGSEGGSQGRGGPDLCLSCSQLESAAEVSFDIDSFLGYAHSLAFARRGITINLFPQFHSNIRTDLHLYYTVYHDFGRGPRPVKVKLHQVPHYYLGRVIGHEDISTYIFFPRMYDPEKPTNFPGKGGGQAHDLLRTWTDRILLPASPVRGGGSREGCPGIITPLPPPC